MDHIFRNAPTVSAIIALLALLLSVISYIRDSRSENRRRIDARQSYLQEKIWELEEMLLSSELREARRCVIESADIIEVAGADYASVSYEKEYLKNNTVKDALTRGGAPDSHQFVGSYSVIIMALFRAASIAPKDSEDTDIMDFWKRQSAGIYGSLLELMIDIRDSRYLLQKAGGFVWPLGRSTIDVGDTELRTTYSDENIQDRINYLNSRKDESIPDITLPTLDESKPVNLADFAK